MSRLISVLDRYTADPLLLVGGVWTAGQSVYLSKDTLLATNDVTDALTTLGTGGGVLGTVIEAPDLAIARDRLVINLTIDEVLLTPVREVLRSRTL